MASKDDNDTGTQDNTGTQDPFRTDVFAPDPFTTTTADADGGTPPAAKKTTAKRAPRKATKKASAPKKAPAQMTSDSPGEAIEVTADADEAKAPARKAAKRAPRKTAKKSVASLFNVDGSPGDAATGAQPQTAQPDTTPHENTPQETAPSAAPRVAPGFGLIFQAPEPTEAPRRRRATAPAAAPAAEPVPTHQARSESRAAQSADSRQDNADDDDSDDTGPDGARRRRRRGGKGRRGRSTGEGGADESSSDTESAESTDDSGDSGDKGDSSDRPSADDDESDEAGASRRRTRRRRRGAAGDGDDQPGTTTRVREPRPARDEVTSVKGSTRLEAKKQRRREGREAGRRRTVITEAEFLARRESVERVMVVRHKQDRTQIGVLEDGVLVEHYVSRETNASMAGNVYLARIQNVLPSMEAAFADIGKGRNAVLYAGEVNWDAAGLDNRAKRIENALSSGQSVLVQVTKDPIGHKGARLTSQVSLPGRYLVYVPDGNMMGISRKLPDTERARLKKILRDVVPENAGVIVRTAAEGASEDELRADVSRLAASWEEIQAKSKRANAPALLHGEPDLTIRVIRDVFNEDFASLVVSGDPAWETVSGYVNAVAPDLADRVQKWTGERDLFTHYRVDEQIAKAMDRKVWLPSGGSLVIDRTEAMTVVDVNTGKFVGSGGNLEETVTKNNIEAAEEIVRQLRLRDIGGIIVIDFIDMVLESNRDLVVRRLLECLGRDRTKHQVAEVTSLGLVQMTRKRVGAGLIEVFSENCEHCNGRGIIVSPDPIERPAGDAGAGGNGGGSGGGDGGSGRGKGGRRARTSGRDTGVSVAPEPKVAPGGPTPAQIAAAAHAAPIHAPSQEEAAASSSLGSGADGQVVTSSPDESAGPAVGQAAPDDQAREGRSQEVETQPDQPQPVQPQPVRPPDVAPGVEVVEAAEVRAPAKSRRRGSRSATSPAVSVEPAAPVEVVTAPVTAPVIPAGTGQAAPEVAPPTADQPTQATEATPPVAPPVTAPVIRGRRKRARVVAPAGPPRVGEFDS